jgi:Domain of unknown function (DUF4395)
MESISSSSSTPVMAHGPRVDAHLAKFSQAIVVVLSGLAFLYNQPVIVALAAICLAVSALAPQASPFKLLYRGVVLPLRLWKPRIVEDDPAPHRFAQGIGTAFLLAALLVLYLTPVAVVGWSLDIVVLILSAINLTVGFCAGCFVYYHLGRLGLMPRVHYEGGFHWRGV